MKTMMLRSYLDYHHVLEEVVVVLPLQSLYQLEVVVLLQVLQLVHLQEVKPYFLGLFDC